MRERRVFVTMEAMRGIAAVCVMLNHYTSSHQDYPYRLFPNPIAPDFFWCLSGFVIAVSYGAKMEAGMSVREFMRRRLIRVYPMYLLGTLFGLISVLIMLGADPLHPRLGSVLLATASAILILPYLLPFTVPFAGVKISNLTFPLDPPAWSLIFELGANALYAVLRPKSRLWFIIIIAGSYYLTVTSVFAIGSPGGPNVLGTFGGIFRAIFSFFVGVLLCEFWNARGKKIIFDLGPLLPCLLLFSICSVPYSNTEFVSLILFGVPLTIWLATSNPRNAIVSSLFRLIGKTAYPVYCIHWPVYQLAQFCNGTIRGIPLNTPLSFVSSLSVAAAVVFASYLLTTFYERPARQIINEVRWLTWPKSAYPETALTKAQ